MPGPAPVVPYSPVPTVEPEVRTRGGDVNTRASAEDFGGAIGSALERGGNQLRVVGDEFAQEALRRQGMINETMATNAETQYLQQLGKVQGDYYTKEGFAAGAGLQDHTAQISSLRESVGDTITNPMARRAYDMISRRHEASAIMDANRYASGQLKTANVQAFADNLTTTIGRAGDINIATDDERFNHDVLGAAQHAVDGILQNRGYMSGTGYSRDAQTGEVTFDDSDQGKAAGAVRKEKLDQAYGQAWDLRMKALSSNDLMNAAAVYQRNRDRIPPATQAKLDAEFSVKLRGRESMEPGNEALRDFATQYNGKPDMVYGPRGGAPAGAAGGATLTPASRESVADSIWQQESGRKAGDYQIQPATFEHYAQPGEDIRNPADHKKVFDRITADLWDKSGGDPARVAVGYFSGPGNIAPAGSPTPWLADKKDANGKTVSSYVSDVTGRLGQNQQQPSVPGPFAPGVGKPGQGNLYETQARSMFRNYDAISAATAARARERHPDDPYYEQQAVQHVQSVMNNIMRQQEAVDKQDVNLVFQWANGEMTKGKVPGGISEIANAPAAVKDAWDRIGISNAETKFAITKKIGTGDDGDSIHYGADWKDVVNAIAPVEGAAPTITDMNGLIKRYNAGGLTWAGVQQGSALLNKGQTEDGQREVQAESQALARIKTAVLSEREISGAKFADPKGEGQFAMAQQEFYDALANPRDGGKRGDMLNPFHNDYIVDNIIDRYKRTLEQQMGDTAQETPQTEKVPEGMAESLRTATFSDERFKDSTDYSQPARAPNGIWYTTVTYADGSKRYIPLVPTQQKEAPGALRPSVVPEMPF